MGAFDHVITLGGWKKDAITGQDYPSSANIRDNFTDFVNDHSDTIYRFLMYRFNLKKQACDDIFQESLCKIYEKLHLYDVSKPLSPWMLTVSYHTAIDFLAKHQPSKDAYRDMQEIETFLDRMQEHSEAPSVDLEKSYKEWLLRYMLSTLGEKNRTIIILAYFEQKSYDEIAEILKCKASGIGTMLSRAKEELSQKIQSDRRLYAAIIDDSDEIT